MTIIREINDDTRLLIIRLQTIRQHSYNIYNHRLRQELSKKIENVEVEAGLLYEFLCDVSNCDSDSDLDFLLSEQSIEFV